MHEAPRELSADRSIGVASDKVESKVSRIARGVVRVCGGWGGTVVRYPARMEGWGGGFGWGMEEGIPWSGEGDHEGVG